METQESERTSPSDSILTVKYYQRESIRRVDLDHEALAVELFTRRSQQRWGNCAVVIVNFKGTTITIPGFAFKCRKYSIYKTFLN